MCISFSICFTQLFLNVYHKLSTNVNIKKIDGLDKEIHGAFFGVNINENEV